LRHSVYLLRFNIQQRLVRHWFAYTLHRLLAVLLQSIIEDDDIKLDWFFKVSLINDLVKVRLKQQRYVADLSVF